DDVDRARFRLYDAIRDILVRAATDRPLLIVLDDIHWADHSSLRLLRFLAVELAYARLLLVATFRDAEVAGPLAGALADLSRQPLTERIMLGGLEPDDVAELVRIHTGAGTDEARALSVDLHRRTDGNPFFVTELVRLLESRRGLHQSSGTGTDATIPAAVGDVVRQRNRRLPDAAQAVLGVAAVVGRDFKLEVLAGACGLDPEDLLDVLEAPLLARVVVETGPYRYRFAHAVVRETVYADLSPSRRARLHGKVGHALEAVHAADLDAHVGELAASAAALDAALAEARRDGDPTLLADAALAFGRVGLLQWRAYATINEDVVDTLESLLRTAPPDDDRLRARLAAGLAVAL